MRFGPKKVRASKATLKLHKNSLKIPDVGDSAVKPTLRSLTFSSNNSVKMCKKLSLPRVPLMGPGEAVW